ncbi:MAG: hypothetical protein AAF957_09320 [Planctomycetota bacterium]
MLRPVAIAALAALLGGCSVLDLEIGRPLDVDAAMAFEPGVTRRADVLAALGPPAGVGPALDGSALLYEHAKLKENQFGLGLGFLQLLFPYGFLSVVKLSLGGSDVDRSAMIFAFDADAVLVGVASSDWQVDYGGGASVQLIVTVQNVVDSESLRRTPRALTWGREMLHPMPLSLEIGNLPAIEMLGSPLGPGRAHPEE